MTQEPDRNRGRLVLVEDGYAANERLLAYEIGGQILDVQLAMQKRFGLRAEPFQVFLVIMLAASQRFIRSANPDPAYLNRSPMPYGIAGGISRRRIADVLDQPFETVRRQVKALMAKDLVVEPRRGQLTTRLGLLALLAEEGVPRSAAHRTLAIASLMLRQGAARLDG